MTIEKLSKMIEVSSGKVLADLVIRNLEHLKAHEELENLVDFQTGYRYHTLNL